MKRIEIVEYYIFNDSAKLKRYETLNQLVDNAKEYITEINSKSYTGIGADFWTIENGNKEFGSLDFINNKENNDKFNWCKDLETLNIELPVEVRKEFEELLKVL